MEAFQFLKQDHRKAEQILSQLSGATKADQRDKLFSDLKHELDSHTEIEEEIFYPSLSKAASTSGMVEEALREHRMVKDMLSRMEGMNKAGEAWRAQVEALRSNVEHHVREEENELFKRAASVLSEGQRRDLGQRMAEHKTRLIQEREQSIFGSEGGLGKETGKQARRWTDTATARSKGLLNDQARNAGVQLHEIAEALHETAKSLEQKNREPISHYLDSAASGVDRLSGQLRDADVDEVVRRVADFARQRPAAFVGGAVAVGFLVSRFLKSSETRSGVHRRMEA